MDKSSLGGILLAVGGITTGLVLDGGNIGQILQPTAAMIVFGGTLGAIMLQFPLAMVIAAFSSLMHVFVDQGNQAGATIAQLVGYAYKARKDGVVSLDSELEKIEEPFLRKSLMLAVDGTEPEELRKMMELVMENQAEREENIPKVFESAGGFSPTIGIIGAVLGLIQVMGHLSDIHEVGRGIAVAFVATIYGVATANLFCLPAAGKLRIRLRDRQIQREIMLEGVISILEGMNPRMLETKLQGFIADTARAKALSDGA